MPSSLVADAAALVDTFSVAPEQLRAFAEAHPVEAIYSELSSSSSVTSATSPTGSIDAASVAVVARALAKVFADAELAAELLPATCPFAVAAVRSQESPEELRALAVEALGRCVAAGVGGGAGGGGEGGNEEASSPASALVDALADGSASVAAAAERGGRIAATTEIGTRALLRAGLVSKMSLSGEQRMEDDRGGGASSPALARARALSVAAAALSAGAGPAAALKQAGAFAAVSEQLSLERASEDPLSAASALATISDAVASVLEGAAGREGRSGEEEASASAARASSVGSLLAAEVGRPLARLLASAGAAPKVIFAVRMQAMQTAAKLVAAAVGESGGAVASGEGNGDDGANGDADDDSTAAAAVAAAPSASSPIPSPASPVGGLAAALLASIERSLDEEAAVGRDGEVAEQEESEEGASTSTGEEEASLLALAELASTAGGASLVAAASPDALGDAARIALGGRGGSAGRLAALHALASVAGVERMRRGERRGRRGGRAGAAPPPRAAPESSGVLLPGAGEAVLASALHSGACSSSAGAPGGRGGGVSGALLSLVSRQPLLDEQVAALRLTLALCARPWGAAEVALHPGLLARLVDVAADAATAAAEWRHAVCVALGETAARVAEAAASSSSPLGPTQLSALAAARPAVEAAVRAGPHGIGGPAPRFVATRAAN